MRSVAGVALAGGILLAGCGMPARASRQIEEAQSAVAAGQYERAEQLVDPVIRSHGKDAKAAPAYYVRAQCRIRGGQRDAAQQDLARVLSLSKDAELRASAEAQLGNIAFDQDDYRRAAAHYEHALARLPRRPPTDRVLLQYGTALQRSGQFDDGRRVFGQLLEQFPSSPHAGVAQTRQAWPENYFAIQCGAFGQQSSAQNLAVALRARGLQAGVFAEARGGGRVFLVRIGRFANYADAARLLERARAVAPDAFVVP